MVQRKSIELFERPVLHDRFGIAPSSEYRDGDVTAVVCDDSGWPLETYWILLDTSNWYGVHDGWTQHSGVDFGCAHGVLLYLQETICLF